MYQLFIIVQHITPKTWRLKTTNIYYLSFCGSEFRHGLAGCLWLRASHEVVAKQSTRFAFISRLYSAWTICFHDHAHGRCQASEDLLQAHLNSYSQTLVSHPVSLSIGCLNIHRIWQPVIRVTGRGPESVQDESAQDRSHSLL